jgi:hypothetical protein
VSWKFGKKVPVTVFSGFSESLLHALVLPVDPKMIEVPVNPRRKES